MQHSKRNYLSNTPNLVGSKIANELIGAAVLKSLDIITQSVCYFIVIICNIFISAMDHVIWTSLILPLSSSTALTPNSRNLDESASPLESIDETMF